WVAGRSTVARPLPLVAAPIGIGKWHGQSSLNRGRSWRGSGSDMVVRIKKSRDDFRLSRLDSPRHGGGLSDEKCELDRSCPDTALSFSWPRGTCGRTAARR